MGKLAKVFVILSVFAVFFGSIPLVLASESDGCACCQSSCDCKAMVCHSGCSPAAAIAKAAFSPDLPEVGAFSLFMNFTYRHKPIHSIFHPPNMDSFVLS
jgi:hypothetical protein